MFYGVEVVKRSPCPVVFNIMRCVAGRPDRDAVGGPCLHAAGEEAPGGGAEPAAERSPHLLGLLQPRRRHLCLLLLLCSCHRRRFLLLLRPGSSRTRWCRGWRDAPRPPGARPREAGLSRLSPWRREGGLRRGCEHDGHAVSKTLPPSPPNSLPSPSQKSLTSLLHLRVERMAGIWSREKRNKIPLFNHNDA